MAAGMFRASAGICRTMIISNTGGALCTLLMFVLGGFILPRGSKYLTFITLAMKLILTSLAS